MNDNPAAQTTQDLRHRLGSTHGWMETKVGHFQYVDEDGHRAERAIQVGYVLGECWVSIQRINQSGVDYGSVAVKRGVGDAYIEEIMAIVAKIQAGELVTG